MRNYLTTSIIKPGEDDEHKHKKTLGDGKITVIWHGTIFVLQCLCGPPSTATKAELQAETNARIAADNTLQTNINSEASTRSAADTTLQTNIGVEAAARIADDTALQNQIDEIAPAGLMIDDEFGGGVVFYVNTTGTHGLVAATQDQSASVTWFEAQNAISNAANHDTAG